MPGIPNISQAPWRAHRLDSPVWSMFLRTASPTSQGTMTNSFIFPGQGSQSVGMGKMLSAEFPQAAAVFAEVDDALGRSCLRGLKLT